MSTLPADRRVLLGGLTALLLVGVGCTSAHSALTSTTATSGSTSPSSTMPAPSTTAADTVATTAPADARLTLRADGLGTHPLGADSAEVDTDLRARFGAPTSDTSDSYPTRVGVGQYNTADGQFQYVAPHSRTECWTNGLCVVFGGATATSMSFTGWKYEGVTDGALRSASGATVGSRWSDVPTMTVDKGGCYTIGNGKVDGIDVVLTSKGTPFTAMDTAGNAVNNSPAAADVSITTMQTGSLPIGLYGDC